MGKKLIRGINKLKLLLEFLCFSSPPPPVLYFIRILTLRTLKFTNNFVLGNIYLPFEVTT